MLRVALAAAVDASAMDRARYRAANDEARNGTTGILLARLIAFRAGPTELAMAPTSSVSSTSATQNRANT